MVYRAREETINAQTHLLAALISTYLTIVSLPFFNIFFFASILTFMASVVYHAAKDADSKEKYRWFDIASIYLFIPATVYDALPAFLALPFFALSALLALPILKKSVNDKYTDITLVGLTSIAAVMVCLFSAPSSLFLLGVACYVTGLPFYFRGHSPWMHTIWHLFVCLGWVIHVCWKLCV